MSFDKIFDLTAGVYFNFTPEYYLGTFFSFFVSLPLNTRNSDGGVTKQALLPLPHYSSMRLHFYREKTSSAFSSLVDPHRIATINRYYYSISR